MPDIRTHAQHARVAYLTMEIGLRAEMHTYSGGLGILAGDIARSAADLRLPMVFVTLAMRQLVSRITVIPKGPVLHVEVEGYLASLLGNAPPLCRETYVAEEGLEPPTRGL